MVTKEQAIEARDALLNHAYDMTDDHEKSLVLKAAYTIGAFIEQPQPVPEGYVLVPVEPTEGMSDAGYEAYGKGHFTPAILDCYRAMIAAAPKPGDDDA